MIDLYGKLGRRHDPAAIEGRQFCHFDEVISGVGDALSSLGIGADTANDIAQIGVPALAGAGVGAVGGAIGGSPGIGALAGGALGALYGGYNVANQNGGLSDIFGGGSTGNGNVSADNGGGTVTDANGNLVNQSDASANSATDTSTGSVGGGGSGSSSSTTPTAASGTKGISKTSLALGALAALASAAGKSSSSQPFNAASLPGPSSTAATQGPLFNANMNPTGYINRTPTTPTSLPGNGYGIGPKNSNASYANSYFTYGPEPTFFTGNQLNLGQGFAEGGAAHEAPMFETGGGSHYVQGPGDGQDDHVNAKLSDGEFVFSASDVARIGNGSNRKGAQKLEEMRHDIAHDAGSPRVVQKKIRKSPLQYLAETK